jgi:hypothetical protein
MDAEHRTATIRALNDAFRTAARGNGRFMMSAGIAAMPEADRTAILDQVRLFRDFTEANDPHGEHDYGSFDYTGERILWKIDYYDPDVRFGSEDPADPAQTCRVLTVMTALEY